MSIKINHATLARQVNGELEYVYPKTDAILVEYDSTQNVKEKIESIEHDTNSNFENKINKPIDEDGSTTNGLAGQVLETNGDGTTSWVSRARIYVGSGDIPDGYDAKIDPEAAVIEIDNTLSVDGAVAGSKAVGDAINNLTQSINNIDLKNKINKPVDVSGDLYDGESGQVLESNGDGTTSWVSRARVYVGSGDMPDGYDVQIDPEAAVIEIDRTLSVDGAVAEASSVGAALNRLEKIINDSINNTINDYILFRDANTGYIYTVKVIDGVLVCISKCLSIAVTTLPTITKYTEGEIFNPNGMVVTATCEDGKTRKVTGYSYPTTALTRDINSITITYVENGETFTTTVPITINSSFNPATSLQDFIYNTNNDGTYTITAWKGTLNGSPSTECVVPDSELVIVNPAYVPDYF